MAGSTYESRVGPVSLGWSLIDVGCKGTSKQRLPQSTCCQKLAVATTCTAARTRPAHSHSNPPVHPTSNRDHPKDTGLNPLIHRSRPSVVWLCIVILLNRFTSIFHTQNIYTTSTLCIFITIISMSLSPSIPLFPTHLHLPPLFLYIYVYIIT